MSYEGPRPFGRAFTAAENAAMTNLLAEDLVFRSPAATKPYHGWDHRKLAMPAMPVGGSTARYL
jgi:hypothetical protein